MGKALTVEELYKRLEDLIVLGYGDKKVAVYVYEDRNHGYCTGAMYFEEHDHVEVAAC